MEKRIITKIQNGYIISKKPIDVKKFNEKRENYKNRVNADVLTFKQFVGE
jgi:hypothetical protein